MMFIKNRTKVIKWLSLALILSGSINAWAYISGWPSYVDNGRCLTATANQDLCVIKDDINISIQLDTTITKNFQRGGGELKIWWYPQSRYSKMIERAPGDYWKPINDSGTYKFKNDTENRGTIVAEAYVVDGDGNETAIPGGCVGTLKASSRFYWSTATKDKGITCTIDKGKVLNRVVFRQVGGPIRTELAMKVRPEDNLPPEQQFPTDRSLSIPPYEVIMEINGCDQYVGDFCAGDIATVTDNFRLGNGSSIKLNDRICSIETNDWINFDTITTSVIASASGKIKEIPASLNLYCSGYSDGNDYRSGVGISNKLAGIKIKTLSDYLPGDTTNSTIGLTTDGKVRTDLYVEASMQPDQECRVSVLKTDNTSNKFGNIISVGKEANKVYALERPSIYWKLCKTNGANPLDTGNFEGRAELSVEYH